MEGHGGRSCFVTRCKNNFWCKNKLELSVDYVVDLICNPFGTLDLVLRTQSCQYFL